MRKLIEAIKRLTGKQRALAIGAVAALVVAFPVAAQNIVTSSGVWYRSGTAMLLNPSTLEIGSSSNRIAKAWLTDLDATSATISSFVSGSLDVTGSNPTVAFLDDEATAGDDNATIDVQCTDVGDGTEDCDVTFSQQIAGAATAFLTADADGNLTLGKQVDLSSNDITGTGNLTVTGTLSLDGGTTTIANADLALLDGLTAVSGADTTIVTGTAGTSGDLSQWNGDGDLVDGPTPPSGTIVGTTDTQTLSGKTLTLPQINDTSSDHQYIFAVSELAADRTVTLPLLTGNDEFTFNDHIQTLTNKTIDTANNTITVVEADISDLQSYLLNVVEDTTPQLGGDLDAQGNNITDFGNLTFKTGSPGGTLRTGTSAADTFHLQAYDTDDSVYRDLIRVTAGGTVTLDLSDGSTIGGSAILSATNTATLTNKTFDANSTGNSLSNVETADIAAGSKSGSDAVIITGTAGTNGNLAQWNGDGDLVDSGSAASDFLTSSSILDDLAETSLARPGYDVLTFWDESDAQFEFITLLEGLSISGNTLTLDSATTSATGTVELATTAETTTGTDTGRAVTPDGLAGSIYGQKAAGIVLFDGDTAVTSGSNTNAIAIPATMDGMNVTDVLATVTDKGITGTTDVTVWKKDPVEGLIEVLSTDVTVGDEFFANDGVVNTSNDDLATGDQLYVEVTGIHSGTAPNGLTVVITAETP